MLQAVHFRITYSTCVLSYVTWAGLSALQVAVCCLPASVTECYCTVLLSSRKGSQEEFKPNGSLFPLREKVDFIPAVSYRMLFTLLFFIWRKGALPKLTDPCVNLLI